jgi:hypothetical protein
MLLLCVAETIRGAFVSSPSGSLRWGMPAAIGAVGAILIAAALRRSIVPEIPMALVWATFGFFAEDFCRALSNALDKEFWFEAAMLLLLGFALPSVPIILKFPRVDDLTAPAKSEPPDSC